MVKIPYEKMKNLKDINCEESEEGRNSKLILTSHRQS